MTTVFYLGTHQPGWLATAGVPLFVSHRRLARYKTLPRAMNVWALDSGGFSELSMFGEWRTTAAEYVAAVQRYDTQIGKLDWAAPQDWMCEPIMIAQTGLSIAEHQRRTVENFVLLQRMWDWSRSDSPFMPVLQGWSAADYLTCWDMYAAAGVDLSTYPLVGIGSVCRRQHTEEIGAIVGALLERDPGLPIHGFGVKMRGLMAYGHLLESADSMAWSYAARHRAALPGCTHANCANCLVYALDWRRRALRNEPAPRQLELFGATA